MHIMRKSFLIVGGCAKDGAASDKIAHLLIASARGPSCAAVGRLDRVQPDPSLQGQHLTPLGFHGRVLAYPPWGLPQHLPAAATKRVQPGPVSRYVVLQYLAIRRDQGHGPARRAS